jgi:type II secretory pathway pseudopilin PulG
VIEQIRNQREEPKSPIPNEAGLASRLGSSSLGFVSDFVLRISNLRASRFRISDFRRQVGFTLMEAVISTVIVAVMLVAALNTVGASKITQHKASLVSRGRMLAESLMSEILQQSYQEPGETYVFGRESGESDTSRAAYDDVDDYHGWTESPLVAKDGTALPNSANWRRTVTVEWVDPLKPKIWKNHETGAKRITVVAMFRNVPQATVVAIKAAN